MSKYLNVGRSILKCSIRQISANSKSLNEAKVNFKFLTRLLLLFYNRFYLNKHLQLVNAFALKNQTILANKKETAFYTSLKTIHTTTKSINTKNRFIMSNFI